MWVERSTFFTRCLKNILMCFSFLVFFRSSFCLWRCCLRWYYPAVCNFYIIQGRHNDSECCVPPHNLKVNFIQYLRDLIHVKYSGSVNVKLLTVAVEPEVSTPPVIGHDLSQLNPIHILTTCFPKTHFVLVIPNGRFGCVSHPNSTDWSCLHVQPTVTSFILHTLKTPSNMYKSQSSSLRVSGYFI
jgi:hypothetical protein